ncbi:MAG: ATP-binding protein [Acidobacteriota bacterium]
MGELEERLLNRMGGWAALVDGRLKVVASSAAAREAYSPLPGSTCSQTFGVAAADCVDCPVRRALEEGASHTVEETFRGLSGEAVEVSVTAVPLLGGPEGPPLVLLLARPKGSAASLPVQSRLASLEAFVGSITHALKGALNSLEGGVYLLESGHRKGDPERARAGAVMVRRNLARVRSVVGNILYYARDREVHSETLSAREVVESTLAGCRKISEALNVDLTGRSAEASFPGDPNAIQAMLVNLVESALDACGGEEANGGGHVVLEARSDPPWIVFEVRHGGTPIDPATLAGALGDVYVPHGADRAGLWIHAACRVARAHGGTVAFSMTEAGEARWVVRLPDR